MNNPSRTPVCLVAPLPQKGAECSNATAAAFQLDLETLRVQAIPSLPEPRWVGWSCLHSCWRALDCPGGLPACLPAMSLAAWHCVLPHNNHKLHRYSPALALLGDGRLHLFGGLLPDRATPARDHWSLAVNLGNRQGWLSL